MASRTVVEVADVAVPTPAVISGFAPIPVLRITILFVEVPEAVRFIPPAGAVSVCPLLTKRVTGPVILPVFRADTNELMVA